MAAKKTKASVAKAAPKKAPAKKASAKKAPAKKAPAKKAPAKKAPAKRASGRGSRSVPRLVIRQLKMSDLTDVQELHRRCYPTLEPWSHENLKNHLDTFPEGQLGVELDGTIVATSSTLVVAKDDLERDHVFTDVCFKGFLRGHDPEGDLLYGIDIAVDPKHRGFKLARRIYDARKDIVRRLNLRGIIFGGRMPGYQKLAGELKPAEYLARVLRKELRDPVITAQRANGFAIRGVLHGYLPSDMESGGNAVLMEWMNPDWVPPDRGRAGRIRVASVQYEMRPIRSFAEFATQCEFFIDTASEYRADFLLFPELLTNQLLALVQAPRPAESARLLDRFTKEYSEFFGRMAMKYNVNIIAGTHLTVEDDVLYNIAYMFHRDGRIDRQYKVHITPSEARWWGVTAGSGIHVFETDRGKVAIAICYDVEFPEFVRVTKARGAQVLFVPYNTDIRSGHLRVRACAQARAVENHMYVVTAGATGNLPQVEGADIHYAQSAILTPSDIAFARDGVAAEATPNIETMLVHDLDLAVLRRMEATGTVRTWPDRRRDLYQVRVTDGDDESFV